MLCHVSSQRFTEVKERHKDFFVPYLMGTPFVKVNEAFSYYKKRLAALAVVRIFAMLTLVVFKPERVFNAGSVRVYL